MKVKYSLSLLAAIILTAGSVLAQQTPPPAPEPPDEPPHVRATSNGLPVAPNRRFTVFAPMLNSGTLVLPMTIPPAARIRATIPESAAVERVCQLMDEVRPDTVLTFAPDGQTGHPDHIAVHHWTADAVRETAIGALQVVANTQEWMDEFLAGMLELNVLMGDPPATWTAPLSLDLHLSEEVLSRKLAALAAQASQTEALRAEVGDEFYRRLIGTERFGRFPA